MNVLVQDLDRNPIDIININIKRIKDSIPCDKEDSADVIILEIHAADSAIRKIYSVENFIRQPFPKLSNLVMFGFPASVIEKSQLGYTKPDSLKIDFSNSKFFNRTTYNGKLSDSTNIYVYNQKLDSLKGFSGAPIFIKDSLSNNWRIWGVFARFGHDNNTLKKFILFPSIDFIREKISKLKN